MFFLGSASRKYNKRCFSLLTYISQGSISRKIHRKMRNFPNPNCHSICPSWGSSLTLWWCTSFITLLCKSVWIVCTLKSELDNFMHIFSVTCFMWQNVSETFPWRYLFLLLLLKWLYSIEDALYHNLLDDFPVGKQKRFHDRFQVEGRQQGELFHTCWGAQKSRRGHWGSSDINAHLELRSQEL